MSGECDKCGEHCLDCKCYVTDMPKPLSRRHENGLQSSEKECPKCGYFLIDIISWDIPLEICQRCYYENQTSKPLKS